MRQRIVLVTGAAPYLGGSATWSRLRAAASQFDYQEVDLLPIADAPELAAAEHDLLTRALVGAAGIVAHGAAAKGAIEATAAVNRTLPVMLISPLLVIQKRPMLSTLRTAAGVFGGVFNRIGETKLRRLRSDSDFLRKQMALIVNATAMSQALFDEARQRIADRLAERAAQRSAEVLRLLLQPVDVRANSVVENRVVLVGDSALDKRIRRRMPFTSIEGAGSAAMLEVPNAVAEQLRSMMG